jgi:hypothetical protein
MERARATWTDERLDDLSRRVDAGFDRVDEDLRQLRTEINARFESLEGRLGNQFDAVEGRLGSRIDGLNRSMLQVGGAIVVSVLATMASVIVTNA